MVLQRAEVRRIPTKAHEVVSVQVAVASALAVHGNDGFSDAHAAVNNTKNEQAGNNSPLVKPSAQ